MKVTVIDIMGFVHHFVGNVMECLREARENGIAVAKVLVDDADKDEA